MVATAITAACAREAASQREVGACGHAWRRLSRGLGVDLAILRLRARASALLFEVSFRGGAKAGALIELQLSWRRPGNNDEFPSWPVLLPVWPNADLVFAGILVGPPDLFPLGLTDYHPIQSSREDGRTLQRLDLGRSCRWRFRLSPSAPSSGHYDRYPLQLAASFGSTLERMEAAQSEVSLRRRSAARFS